MITCYNMLLNSQWLAPIAHQLRTGHWCFNMCQSSLAILLHAESLKHVKRLMERLTPSTQKNLHHTEPHRKPGLESILIILGGP